MTGLWTFVLALSLHSRQCYLLLTGGHRDEARMLTPCFFNIQKCCSISEEISTWFCKIPSVLAWRKYFACRSLSCGWTNSYQDIMYSIKNCSHNDPLTSPDRAGVTLGRGGGTKTLTAGLPISWTVGRRHNFCCRGPILIPRPDSETAAQMTRVNALDFL